MFQGTFKAFLNFLAIGFVTEIFINTDRQEKKILKHKFFSNMMEN